MKLGPVCILFCAGIPPDKVAAIDHKAGDCLPLRLPAIASNERVIRLCDFAHCRSIQGNLNLTFFCSFVRLALGHIGALVS